MKPDMQIMTLLRKWKQKRIFRRIIAMMSVIVLLVTINTLKVTVQSL